MFVGCISLLVLMLLFVWYGGLCGFITLVVVDCLWILCG